MELLYNILLFIDGIIYSFIDKVYQIFMALASARILTNETIEVFVNRLYIILGVVMLFVLSYSILVSIINPDNMMKAEGGTPKILKNTVIALVFLALTPAAFNMLYRVQDVVLTQNVLGKIVLGSADFDSGDVTATFSDVTYTDESGTEHTQNLGSETVNAEEALYQYGGRAMAYNLFYSFFQPAEGYSADEIKAENAANYVPGLVVGGSVALCAAGIALAATGVGAPVGIGLIATCALGVGTTGWNIFQWFQSQDITLTQAGNIALGDGNFGIFAAFTENIVDGEIQYTALISTIAGIIVLYTLFSFCIDLGVRAAKLAYFQMIAPVPILMKIIPKGGKVFDTWLKKTFSTFVEVFIRIIVIYFVIFLVCNLPEIGGNLWNSTFYDGAQPAAGVALFVRAFIILGLVVFAKQAPKLFSEMLGIKGGDMKLGIREKLADAGVMRGGAAIGAGIQTGIKNFNNQKGWRKLTSGVAGFAGGAVGGFKGAKDAKTWSAMNKARTEAANKAVKKSEDRQKRHNQYVADATAENKSVARMQVEDAWHGVKRWVGAESDSLALYDKFIAQQDKVDSTTDKVISKFGNNAGIIARMSQAKWKGDASQQAAYQAIYDTLVTANNMSFDAMDSYLTALRNRDTSSMSDAQLMQHNRDVANTATMIAQLKKETRIGLQDAAFDAAALSRMGLKEKDMADVRTELGLYNDILVETGMPIEIEENGSKIKVTSLGTGKRGERADKITGTIKEQRNKVRVEEERRKRRQGDSK